MRMMLRFSLPVERSNQAFADGSLGSTLEAMLANLKPEAAYFGPVRGKRGGTIVFDMADPSQIPVVLEPLFRNLDAAVELFPVMTPDELKKGIGAVMSA